MTKKEHKGHIDCIMHGQIGHFLGNKVLKKGGEERKKKQNQKKLRKFK